MALVTIHETGDAIIALHNTGVVFAVWESRSDTPINHHGAAEAEEKGHVTDGEGTANSRDADRSSSKKTRHQTKREIRMKHGREGLDQDRGSEKLAPSTQDPSYTMAKRVKASVEENGEHSPNGFESVHEIMDGVKATVDFRVSFQHLSTASPRFRSEMRDPGVEHNREKGGVYQLTANNWDQYAFEIFLNVLHVRYRQVPKVIPLEMLAKVAVLVDYYRCWEAFDLIATVWVTAARQKSPVPKFYGRDLMMWMLVSWVFKVPVEFTRTTAIAMRQSEEPKMRNMGLPFPPYIIGTLGAAILSFFSLNNTDAIEQGRNKAIEEVITSCHNWLDKFCNDEFDCPSEPQSSFQCTSMLLGALTKGLKRLGCLTPRPIVPFHCISLEGFYKEIQTIVSPSWHSRIYKELHSCSFGNTLLPDINRIMARTLGLNFEDFRDYGDGMERVNGEDLLSRHSSSIQK